MCCFTLIGDRRIPDVTTTAAHALGCRTTAGTGRICWDIGIAELMLAPRVQIRGRLRWPELDFRPFIQRDNALAVRTRGRPVSRNLAEQRLDFGDRAVGGNWHDIHKISNDRRNFFLLNLPSECEGRLAARTAPRSRSRFLL